MNGKFRQVRATAEGGRAVHGERLPRFIGGVENALAVLRRIAVAIIGCGAVGSAAAAHLARLGVGALYLVDRGRLKAESVLTHPVRPRDVGQWKVDQAAEAALEVRPDLSVLAFRGDVRELSHSAWDGCGLVLLAVDNLAAELEVGQLGLRRRMPVIQASVHGPSLVAQVRTFTGAGACAACGFGAAEWGLLAREARFSCDGSKAGESVLGPTLSPSSLCSLAADLAVHRLLRHVLRLGSPLADELLEYRGYGDVAVRTRLLRNPECPCEHRRWERATRPADATVGGVLAAAGVASGSLEVPGRRYVERALCTCGADRELQRFVGTAEDLGPCGRCGGRFSVSPFHSRGALAVAPGSARAAGLLARLGIDSGDDVIVRSAGARVVCVGPAVAPAPVGGAR